MPICTSCTHPTPYLYTVYQSAYNFRLEQCEACHAFADPYVEHDTLTLLLDLILLKRDVFRHLLFNRGLGARKVGEVETRVPPEKNVQPQGTPSFERQRERSRWLLILELGSVLICVDAFIRWTHLSVSAPSTGSAGDLFTWNKDAIEGFLRILCGCFVGPSPSPSASPPSGIRQEFRYSHVPLTLFYSSLTKLFLLFLLSIWRPVAQPRPPMHPAAATFTHPLVIRALEVLDEDKLDREWVVRNVLGGMAAGFGLRVVLDCHPVFTTMIILAGWLVKTAVANLYTMICPSQFSFQC
ncbi:Protein arv1 [Grifola frondosa]|uniref:Protein ARV n=1 Tax=Grifola frondosa TaxID=5627 RepID=A0A1C7M6D9_GRIFR|nr:Protein arv1 [Grifola frondosa]